MLLPTRGNSHEGQVKTLHLQFPFFALLGCRFLFGYKGPNWTPHGFRRPPAGCSKALLRHLSSCTGDGLDGGLVGTTA